MIPIGRRQRELEYRPDARAAKVTNRIRHDHHQARFEQGGQTRRQNYRPLYCILRCDRSRRIQCARASCGARKRGRDAIHDDHFSTRPSDTATNQYLAPIRRRGSGRRFMTMEMDALMIFDRSVEACGRRIAGFACAEAAIRAVKPIQANVFYLHSVCS